MPKKSKADLEKMIKDLQITNLNYANEINRLHGEIKNLKDENNIVSKEDYNIVVKKLEEKKEDCKMLLNIQKSKDERLNALTNAIQELKIENETLTSKLGNNQKMKNERGAGRKTKITDDFLNAVLKLKNEGMSFREIAKELNVSVGLVHKAYSLCSHSIV